MLAAGPWVTPLPEQIANALPALISYVDAGQRYRFVNRAYEQWFAVTATELIGRTVAEVLGDEIYSLARQYVERALAGEEQRFEVMVPYRGGPPRRVEAHYVPERDDRGAILGYYALVLDRSDIDVQHRVSEMIDVFEDGFFAVDRDWKIIYCNRAAEAFGILTSRQMIGQDYWEMVPLIAGSELEPILRRVMRDRQPDQIEGPSRVRPNAILEAKVFPVDPGLGVSFRDVTEDRRRLERERAQAARLTELERRRSFLLELADALRVLSDPAQVVQESVARLGRFLDVARVGYAEIEGDSLRVLRYGDWTDGSVETLAGSVSSFSALSPESQVWLRAGKVLSVPHISELAWRPPRADIYSNRGIVSMLVAPHLRGGELDCVLYAHHTERRNWTDEDSSLLQDVAARTWSALARARSERALRESEARFRAMADSAPAPVWVTAADGAMEFVNQPFAELAGMPPDRMRGDIWLSMVHPDDLRQVAEIRAAARDRREGYTFEARFKVASGGWRWMRASSKPRLDEHGLFQGYVGIAVDVTDAKMAEERQRLLINELNHRVKNTLATVQSLAHQTLRDNAGGRMARDQFTERLLALSAAHNVLTRENWEGAEVGELVTDAVRPYQSLDIPRITTAGPAARVSPHVALALSMALHELATNAVKYGALSSPDGGVEIAWSAEAGAAAADLRWREHDGPTVSAPSRQGFGTRLLRQGLAAELGAPAVVDYAADGLTCRLRVPLTPA